MTSNPKLPQGVVAVGDAFETVLRVEIASDDPAKVAEAAKAIADIILDPPAQTGDVMVTVTAMPADNASGISERQSCIDQAADEDALEGRDFYELMQAYRHCPISGEDEVVLNFEAVKNWIRTRYKPPDNAPEDRHKGGTTIEERTADETAAVKRPGWAEGDLE